MKTDKQRGFKGYIRPCAMCGEEIKIYEGQRVHCPYCDSSNIRVDNQVVLYADYKRGRI